MASKRQNVNEPTGREKKKQKVSAARTIAVQSVVQDPGNAVAGPSNLTKPDGITRLPSAIDVERFAEARSFEINAMQDAMKTASTSSTQRAWQALPRHLRRRAASHDIRRVPLRLREKARAEMDPIRKKALGRSTPKIGKAKRMKRTDLFLKRQRDKVWLETHLWHAKRMKMEDIWGYRLATHPTEKAFRPSHRASVHGSIIHDASYHGIIELQGPESAVRTILETCCDPQGQGPGAIRYRIGSRVLETHLYKPGSYPFDLIAPITVMWKSLAQSSPSADDFEPVMVAEESNPTQVASDGARKRKRKGKGKGKEKSRDKDPDDTTTGGEADLGVFRTVWLQSHPSVFDEVLSSLKAATSAILDAIKRIPRSADSKEVVIGIADLRRQVNVFEIMGPKSNQVLKGALTPVTQDSREDFAKFWSMLSNLQTSGSIPRGMIVGFKVNDPRLKFPPKNAKPNLSIAESMLPTDVTFPSAALARSEIWDEPARAKLRIPRFKKKDLDERRSKNLIPGTPLNALRQDDRVPVLLIQRSLESSGSQSDSQTLHGWTLIVPAGWSMPFFSSLIFTGTRVGGQRERQVQAFETGTAYFARDYPSTTAYDAFSQKRETDEKDKWERKPPAKRANFDKLGTRSPWRADWEVVLGLKNATQDNVSKNGKGEEFAPAQREEMDEMTVNGSIARPWLLRGAEVSGILSNVSKLFNHGAGLLSEINRLRLKRGQEPLGADIRGDDLLKGALVSIKVMMCSRGAPEDLAVIYSVGDDEARKWEKDFKDGCLAAKGPDDESPEEIELSEARPPQEPIIGYVTTGQFSLSRGEGFAIGAIPVQRLLELQQQVQRLYSNSTSKPHPLVKVRNRAGHQCRVAYIKLLDS